MFNLGNMSINTSGSNIQINGVSYSGTNVSMINGKVIVDGVEQTGEMTGNIEIVVEGSCGDITTEFGNISVGSNAKSVESKNGNISVGGTIEGNAETKNGNIKANSILGEANTKNGNIRGK